MKHIKIEAVMEETNKWGTIPMVKTTIDGKIASLGSSAACVGKCPTCNRDL